MPNDASKMLPEISEEQQKIFDEYNNILLNSQNNHSNLIDCIPTHVIADTIVQWSVCSFDEQGDYIMEIGILDNRKERVVFTDINGWYKFYDTIEEAISEICFSPYDIDPRKLN